jgi:hypothetical protein
MYLIISGWDSYDDIGLMQGRVPPDFALRFRVWRGDRSTGRWIGR